MRYMALDIETGAATEAALETELSKCKASPNTKDPAKIKRQIEDKQKNVQEKSALTNAAPVLCVGTKSDSGFVIFTGYDFQEKDLLTKSGIEIISRDGECEMLVSMIEYFKQQPVDNHTVLATFNGRNFDLPKLRLAFARNGLSRHMPEFLLPHNNHIDLMRQYLFYYSISNSQFVSMSEAVVDLGIVSSGKLIKGALFPKMIEEGKFFEATLYNALDCILTEKMFLKIC